MSNILNAICDRMVHVTKELECKLNENKNSSLKEFRIEGWDSNVILENSNFVISKTKAKAGSTIELKKNHFSHICLLRLNNCHCNIKLTECKSEKCDNNIGMNSCKETDIIEIILADSYPEDGNTKYIYKNDIVHVSPYNCYRIEILEDSEFLLCLLSSDVE